MAESDPLHPTAYDQLIGTSDLRALAGIGHLMALLQEEPRLRNAMLLRATTRLRDVLQAHSYEADEATTIQLDLQDATVLLDLLLRRLG